MGGACGTYGEVRGSCTGSVGMPDGKRPLGSPRCRWEDNFKMELPGIKLGTWTDLVQDRDGWWFFFSTKLRGSIKYGKFLDELRNYQLLNTLLHGITYC